MWSTPFDPAADAILIEVEIFGPMGSRRAWFVLDVDPETLVDGLIGLDFLRTRILTIDGVNGQITLGP